MIPYVKAVRSDQASFLDHHPNANHLLNVIARRSRRTKCNLNMLEIGECFISFRSVGMTEQQYRTAKKQLQKWGLVGFKKGRRVTDKGTVALLLNSDVYDINTQEGNGRVTEEQRKGNGRVTTNKECKKEKNGISKDIYQQIAGAYNESFPELSNVIKVSQKRKAHINATIKEFKGHHDLEDLGVWRNLFGYISKSDFLMGRSSDWSCDFDFLINKNNLLKIVEGKYDNNNG